MKILVLEPHPFYQEQGSSIAVNHLLRALSELGHTVDLLTVANGEDVALPGLTIYRTSVSFFVRAYALALRKKPDVIHAIDESVFAARAISASLRIPFLYGIDRSVPERPAGPGQALASWRTPMREILRKSVSGALAVIPACPALTSRARELYDPMHLIELGGVSLIELGANIAPAGLRKKLGLRGLVFMYAGSLESHQGIELLLEAFSLHHKRHRDDALVIIGGTPGLIAAMTERTIELACADSVYFLGPRPVAQLAANLAEADVLVSPRIKGQSAPSKIYSYLDSGRAVLATRLYTHTQIVDDEHCMLCDPTPEQLSEGMRKLARSPDLRKRLAAEAKKLVERKHTYSVFKATVETIYKLVAESRGEKFQ